MMFLMKATYLFVFAALSGIGPTTVIASSGCCSLNYKSCISWCGNTQNSCLKCNHKNGVAWLENGAQENCRKRWNGCENHENDCCDGLVCREDKNNYMTCMPPKERSTTKQTNNDKNGCCSLDFVNCIDWCGPTKDSCLNCNHHDGVGWMENGPPKDQCLGRWTGCKNNQDGCCNGLTCEHDGNNYLMCLPSFLSGELSQTLPPSASPSAYPSASPTSSPSESPSSSPSEEPSESPSESPSEEPSEEPSKVPSEQPSEVPSEQPSEEPSESPSESPSEEPSEEPSESPSFSPSEVPSEEPSQKPSQEPSQEPSESPSESPSASPTASPSSTPTFQPTFSPTKSPKPCCTLDYKNCISWCGPTYNSCASCNHHDGVGWLQNGPPKDKCLSRWSGCGSNVDGCCDGLVCKEDANNYLMCLPKNPIGTKAPTTFNGSSHRLRGRK